MPGIGSLRDTPNSPLRRRTAEFSRQADHFYGTDLTTTFHPPIADAAPPRQRIAGRRLSAMKKNRADELAALPPGELMNRLDRYAQAIGAARTSGHERLQKRLITMQPSWADADLKTKGTALGRPRPVLQSLAGRSRTPGEMHFAMTTRRGALPVSFTNQRSSSPGRNSLRSPYL